MKFNNFLDILLANAKREKFYEILEKTKRPIPEAYREPIDQNNSVNVIDVRIENKEVLMDIDGHETPLRGIPDDGILRIVAIYKRFLPLFAKKIQESNIFNKVIIILFVYFNYNIFSRWVRSVLERENCYLKDEYYFKSTKELKRVLKKFFDKDLVDAGTLVFQMDNAYRYRLQDFIGEIKKENIKGYLSVKKEIKRVFSVYLDREGDNDVKEKIIHLKKIIDICIIFPKINKLIKNIISELDIDKIKFDDIDRYWVGLRKDGYKYNI